jgi:N-acetylglucosamine-6-phosphate deacetylase
MPGIKAYTADRIFTGDEWLSDKAIIVKENRIEDLLAIEQLPASISLNSYPGSYIVPSFIDLQIYGAYGKLLAVYPEPASLYQLRDYCLAGGAAHCLPTVATNTRETFFRCIDAVNAYWQEGGKGVLGLHLEGPWINPLKRGAHIASLIHPPVTEEVKAVLEYGRGVIKMITLAPELCNPEVLDLFKADGIIISAGHSNATYDEAMKGFGQGITAVTHLYNAMSPLQHRAPGLVGAAMDHEQVMASIIPDGYHVDFAAIRIAKQVMKERLFVITDAVTETEKGYYPHQKAGDKYEAAGILSGSALTMNKAVQNLVERAGIALPEALRMCSLYPARVMRMDHELGQIRKGALAAFTVMKHSFDVTQVFPFLS